MPHPPVLRALEHSKRTLEKAGHEVITFDLPFDAWDTMQITFDIYYQVFNPREHSAREALQLNLKTRSLKEQFAEAWNNTVGPSGRTIDALIMPPAPAVGYPHDFNIYWGYTSLLNVLDYPSVNLPIPNFKVDPQLDPVDDNYRPLERNPYDKPNYELYDPELFANQPSSIQIAGRPFEDEETIRVGSVLDTLFRAP